jgi:hypothetical protein
MADGDAYAKLRKADLAGDGKAQLAVGDAACCLLRPRDVADHEFAIAAASMQSAGEFDDGARSAGARQGDDRVDTFEFQVKLIALDRRDGGTHDAALECRWECGEAIQA